MCSYDQINEFLMDMKMKNQSRSPEFIISSVQLMSIGTFYNRIPNGMALFRKLLLE
jgi:hypothetical protein